MKTPTELQAQPSASPYNNFFQALPAGKELNFRFSGNTSPTKKSGTFSATSWKPATHSSIKHATDMLQTLHLDLLALQPIQECSFWAKSSEMMLALSIQDASALEVLPTAAESFAKRQRESCG